MSIYVCVMKGDLNEASENLKQPVLEVNAVFFRIIMHYCFVSSLLCG